VKLVALCREILLCGTAFPIAFLPCMNAFAGHRAHARQPMPYMEACFDGAAQYHHVNPVILRSIARVESGYNPRAFNRNPNGTFDYGVMQINSSWFPRLARFGILPAQLADPCINIYIGAWILSGNMREHGNTWKAIGKYNAASDVAGIRYERKIYGEVMAQLKGGQ